MKKYYVAHEAFLFKEYDGKAFAHDLIGCRLQQDYYISKKVVLLERWKDGNYHYSGTSIIAASDVKLDPNDFISSLEVLGCNNCEQAKFMNGGDCQYSIPTQKQLLGVVNIIPLAAFTNIDDDNLSLMLIKEYNDSVQDDEYILVNDMTYATAINKINKDYFKTLKKKIR